MPCSGSPEERKLKQAAYMRGYLRRGTPRYEVHLVLIRANKQRYRTRNRLIAHRHLLAHPCIDCGETDIDVLEFDHVSGEKLDVISRMVGLPVGETKLRAEIAKCAVRCANCHRRKTRREGMGSHTKTSSITTRNGEVANSPAS